jgi:hypothetical protein
MIDKICVIIPTHKRLLGFRIFASSWKKTTEGFSDVVVGVDDDDNTYDELIASNIYPNFIWERGKSRPCLDILNDLALKYCDVYKYLAFMEDDTLFNTPGWETIFITKLQELGKNGIVWGNDLRVGEKHIGLPFMDSSIVKRLGYMSPRQFHGQCPDLYWTELGKKIKSVHYFPDVVTEHRHFSTGKTFKDETACKINKDAQDDFIYLKSDQYWIDLDRDANLLLS